MLAVTARWARAAGSSTRSSRPTTAPRRRIVDVTGLAPVETLVRIACGRDAADIAWAGVQWGAPSRRRRAGGGPGGRRDTPPGPGAAGRAAGPPSPHARRACDVIGDQAAARGGGRALRRGRGLLPRCALCLPEQAAFEGDGDSVTTTLSRPGPSLPPRTRPRGAPRLGPRRFGRSPRSPSSRSSRRRRSARRAPASERPPPATSPLNRFGVALSGPTHTGRVAQLVRAGGLIIPGSQVRVLPRPSSHDGVRGQTEGSQSPAGKRARKGLAMASHSLKGREGFRGPPR